MQTAMGLAHGLDFLTSLFLIGSLGFFLFVAQAGGELGTAIDTGWKKRTVALLWATLFTSTLFALLTCAQMTDGWNASEMIGALTHTSFGYLWSIRIALLILISVPANFLLRSYSGTFLVFLLTCAIPVTSALSGHAAMRENFQALAVSLDFLHYLAAALWTGGLISLFFWLGGRLRGARIAPEVSRNVVERFSKLAQGSTAVIAASGVWTAYTAGVSIWKPWETPYGSLILAKTTLFALALGAAAINQFVHIRNWTPETEGAFVTAIKREVGLEICLITAVLLVAGFLTGAALPGTNG